MAFVWRALKGAVTSTISEAVREEEEAANAAAEAQRQETEFDLARGFYGNTARPPRKKRCLEDEGGAAGRKKQLGLTPPGARGRDSMYTPLPNQRGPRRQSTVTFQGEPDLRMNGVPVVAGGAALTRGNSLTSEQLTNGVGSFSRLPPRRGGQLHQQFNNEGVGAGAGFWNQTPRRGLGFDPVAQHPDAAIQRELQQFNGGGRPLVGGSNHFLSRQGRSKTEDPHFAFGTPSTSLERMHQGRQGGGSSSMGALGRSCTATAPSAWELPLPNNQSTSCSITGLASGSFTHPSQRSKILGFGGGGISPQTSPSKDAGLRPLALSVYGQQRLSTFVLEEDQKAAASASRSADALADRTVGRKADRDEDSDFDEDENFQQPHSPLHRHGTAAAGTLCSHDRRDTDQMTLRAESLSLPPEGAAEAEFGRGDSSVGDKQRSSTTFACGESQGHHGSRLSSFLLEGEGPAAAADSVAVLSHTNKKKSRSGHQQYQQVVPQKRKAAGGRNFKVEDFAVYGSDESSVSSSGAGVAGSSSGHLLEQKLFEERVQDEAMTVAFDEMFRVLVKDVVHNEVQKEMNTGFGAMFGFLLGQLKKIAIPLCPKSTGVLKCAKTGSKYSLPVEFDAVDEATLAGIHCGSQETVVVTPGGAIEITKRHLKTLEGQNWLADPVINGYCKLIEELLPNNNILCLNSFFYSKLEKAGYGGTSRWTRKMDLFAQQKVLVVINKDKHWTLAVINMKRKRLEYYDSLGGKGGKVLTTLRDYLDDEWVARKRNGIAFPVGEGPFTSDWTLHQPGSVGIPQQNNGVDCGVFTTQFALYAALDSGHFNFGQADVKYMRQLIQLELLGKKLLARL